MSDQKVTVRVEAQKAGDVSKPFKDVAKEAAGAEKAVKALGRAQDEMGGSAKKLSRRGLGFSYGANKAIGAVAGGAGAEVEQALGVFNKINRAGSDAAGALALLSGRVEEANEAFESGLLGPAVKETVGMFDSASAGLAKMIDRMKGGSGSAEGTWDRLARGSARAQETTWGRALFKWTGASAVVGGAQKGLEAEAAAKQAAEQAATQQRIAAEDAATRQRLQQAAGRQRLQDDLAGLRDPDGQRKYFRSQQDEARMVLENAQGKGATGQQEREAAQKRIVEMAKQERDITIQMIDQRKKAVDVAKQLVDVEKERLKDSAASFGQMGKGEQRRAMSVAEKLSRGEELTRGDAAFARGKGFFDSQLRDRDAAKGQSAGFAEFARMLGLDKNLNKAQADLAAAEKLKVELETKLKVELGVDFDSASSTLSEKIAAELKKLMEIESQRAAAEVARQAQAQRANQGAANQ